MEQLSFSNKLNEKIFFLGALSGLGKMGAATGRAAARTSRTIRQSVSRPNIPQKISSGNKKQEN
jgi:hypothetical protein